MASPEVEVVVSYASAVTMAVILTVQEVRRRLKNAANRGVDERRDIDIAATATGVRELVANNAKLEAELVRYREIVAKHEARIAQLEAARDTRDIRMESLEVRIDALQKALDGRDATVEELRRHIALKDARIAELEALLRQRE